MLPVARALVDRQQGQQRLGGVGAVLELAQRRLGAVEQAGLQEVLRQRMLGPLQVLLPQVATLQQVLVHAHRALVVAAAAEQVAEREMQLRGLGVVLHRLDEGVDRLVLLLVEQQIESAEIGFRVLLALGAPLAQVVARGQPAQHEGDRQAPEQPAEVKCHG